VRRAFHVFHRFFSDLFVFLILSRIAPLGAAIDPICYVTISFSELQSPAEIKVSAAAPPSLKTGQNVKNKLQKR